MKYILSFVVPILLAAGTAHTQITPAHTVVLVLENKAFSQIVGSPLCPYINSLLADANTATLTQSYGLTHPSQPNYLHLFSGSAQGVITNNLPTGLPFTTPNLGAALLQAGLTFAGYSEDLPATGYTGEISGAYARKHSPWINWQGTSTNGIPAALNKPFTDFPTNYATLPAVSFVIPNQDNDMHNGSLEDALGKCDAWVQQNLNPYIQWCKNHNSLFILHFDEDDNSHNNQILTSLTGEFIIAGNYSQPLTHHNVLRTVEELYHLPYAGASQDSSPIRDIWKKTAVCKGSGLSLGANIAAATYQWQVDAGTGFTNITDNTNYTGTAATTLQLSNIPSAWYGYQYRCLCGSAYSTTKTINFINYWTGAISDEWENPLNWSCGSLPDQNTDVVINSRRPVVLNSAATVRSFTATGGAVFTQKNNQQLTIAH